jgi:hypothetical protein
VIRALFAAAALIVLALGVPLAGAAFDPTTPLITSSTPSSPANDNTPILNGAADPGSLITVYTDSNCLLGVAGTGTADSSGDFHVSVTVPVTDDVPTTFYATATDLTPATSPCSTGFDYVEDSTSPDTAIQGSPPSFTDATASFAFAGDDGSGSGVASFQCSLDGDSFAACTSPQSYSGLGSGPHTFAVRAIDQAGNADQTPDSVAWAVDATPPETSIQGSPPGVTDATASFAFAGDDGSGSGVASFQCSLDGDSFAACTSPQSYSGLGSGPHTFAVRAVDNLGNVDPTPDSVTWTVDATPPQTTITSGPPDPSASTSASFDFSGDDGSGSGVASFQCALDSSGFAPCTSPAGYPGLDSGTHTFYVRATDQVGNVDPSPDSFTWVIDTSIPTTTITSGPNGPSNDASPSFTFTSSASGATFTCSLDEAAFVACTSPQSYSGLGNGTHTFQVKSRNAAGSESAPASRTWLIDTGAPDTSISSNPSNPTASTTASFAFVGSDADSGVASFQCSLDASAFASCTSPQSHSGLGDGSHTFSVRASDGAGNVDPSPDSFTWVVDTSVPTTTITLGPSGPTNATSASFAFTSSASGATFTCSRDGAAFSSCTSPQSYSGLGNGTHTFRVISRNAAGTDSPPATRTWLVDTGAPETTVSSHPSNPTASASASFDFGGSDGTGSGVGSFECRLDAAAFAPCTSPQSYSGLANGSHTFRVRAVDRAGNVDGSPASFTWVVDTLAPETTITSPTPTPNSTAATFSFSGGDGSGSGVARFQCSLDAAAFASCTSPKSYFGLASGEHTFAVRAIDGAGNVDATPDSVTWTIDTDQPIITISGPANPTNVTVASFSFAANKLVTGYRCSLDGSAFATCTSPQAFPGPFADGQHIFAVEATDTSGNEGSAGYTWTVDTVPPTVSIVSTPIALSNDTVASFAFSANEAGSSFQCDVDGSGFSACPNPQTYTGVGDGTHTFTVRSIDPAGNVAPTPDSFTWTVDTAPPETGLQGFPPNPSGSRSATFGFAGSDPSGISAFQCELDGAGFATCANPASYSGLSDGLHTFRVRSVDGVGNVDPAPSSYTWAIDATPPPSPVITAAPSTPNGTSSATFTFTDAEPSAAMACRVDGGAASDCSSGSATYSGLADGPHTFRVASVDALGNQSAAATYGWTIDTVHPLVTLTDKPPLLTNRTSVTFAFVSNRPGSSYECRLDGGEFGACRSPQLFRGLHDGSHTFAVRAISLGNVGLATAYTWTVDTIAPETRIASGPPANSHSASPKFSFTSTEAQSTFACALDSGGYGPCSSPKSYARLADGTHTFRVEAVDAAGNADASAATYAWKITGGGGIVDVPPRNVSRLKPTVGYGSLRLRWRSPADADFDHVGVYVSTSAKSPPRTLLYSGRARSYMNKKFKNGLYYRYLVVSYDHAENASRGASLIVPTSALLRSPRQGRLVRSAPLFRWVAVPKASFYNIQVFSGGQKILSAWPEKARQPLAPSWTYAGRRFALRKGRYIWYVWPGFGPKAKSHYGQLLGQGTFRVR